MDRSPVAGRAAQLRPAAGAAGRRGRLGHRGPGLPAPRRMPRCTSTSPATGSANRTASPHGFPAAGQPRRRHGGRPARPRHRLPGLVLTAAGRRRTAGALRRPDGRGQAVPAHRDGQQPGRGNPDRLRPVHPVLPGRPGGRPAVGHPAAVPGPGRRAGGDHRPDQPQPVHHPLSPTTTVTTTASSASSAASAWSSAGIPRNSRCWRPGAGGFTNRGPGDQTCRRC